LCCRQGTDGGGSRGCRKGPIGGGRVNNSYHLLSKGYSMPVSNTPIEIHDIKSWTLGMMLVEANKLLAVISDEDNMMYSNLLQSYECIITGSTLVLLLLSSFIWRRRKQRRKLCLPYEL
jgi:hypothetical protein